MFVTYKASREFVIENIGQEEFILFKIFGADVY